MKLTWRGTEANVDLYAPGFGRRSMGREGYGWLAKVVFRGREGEEHRFEAEGDSEGEAVANLRSVLK